MGKVFLLRSRWRLSVQQFSRDDRELARHYFAKLGDADTREAFKTEVAHQQCRASAAGS